MRNDHVRFLGLVAQDVPPDAVRPTRIEEWKAANPGRRAVHERFVAQLGPRWTGLDGLSRLKRELASDLLAGLPPGMDRDQAVRRAGEAHAYETGVILALMALRRPDGRRMPQPGPGDATLTALASSFGRPSPFVEAMGAIAHWLAERKAGVRLERPSVKVAVDIVAEIDEPTASAPSRPASIWAA